MVLYQDRWCKRKIAEVIGTYYEFQDRPSKIIQAISDLKRESNGSLCGWLT